MKGQQTKGTSVITQIKRGIIMLIAGIALIAAVLPGTSIAGNPHYPIGEIAFLEGDALLHKGKNKKAIEQGDPVYLGNLIETQKDSKLLILFIDDTRITLAEESELMVDEFVFDPYDSSENTAEFSAVSGAFHWVSGMISKRDEPDVAINTSFGSIGIRGTEFWAGEIEKGYGIFVDDGLVSFAGDWGATELPAESSTYITKASASEDQDFWTDKRRTIAQNSVTFKMARELDQRLSEMVRENIRKRHDYRGQMFPYKENPFRPRPAPEEDNDDFFSDEFEKMKERKQQQ